MNRIVDLEDLGGKPAIFVRGHITHLRVSGSGDTAVHVVGGINVIVKGTIREIARTIWTPGTESPAESHR